MRHFNDSARWPECSMYGRGSSSVADHSADFAGIALLQSKYGYAHSCSNVDHDLCRPHHVAGARRNRPALGRACFGACAHGRSSAFTASGCHGDALGREVSALGRCSWHIAHLGRGRAETVRTTLSHSRESVQLPSDEADRVWMLAAKAGPHIWAASCSKLMTVDVRASTPANVVASTSHSAETLRRSKITSICTPSLDWDSPLVAMSTTDVVEYYDARYPSVPLHTWTHRRGFDRSLFLTPLGSTEHAMLCLSSQRNRLRSLYDVRREKASYLNFSMPSMLRAMPMLANEPVSPAPPCFVDMTTLSGWEDWAPAHHGHVLQLEQTMRNALYAQWLGPLTEECVDKHSAASQVLWSSQAQRNESEARHIQDPGPFGELETTHVDFRALFPAAILGWLGTDTPFTLEETLPKRITDVLTSPTELARTPHTLYVYRTNADSIDCIIKARLPIVLAPRSCTFMPQRMARHCWHPRPVRLRWNACGTSIPPPYWRPWSMPMRPEPRAK